MRYLIDTNIIIYMVGDPDLLSKDVKAIIAEPDTLLDASAESAKELVVAYRNKGLFSKRWKTPEEMLHSIEKDSYIEFLLVKLEHVFTYSRMDINERQCHKDPSDHVIIAHAITERMPLISSDTRFEFYRSQGLDLIFNEK
ncbi:MAG: PIN domain-containing protein [Bacteroides sp.]|nr:PIN domain-containing protein [Bacteroides sp.]